MRHLSILIVAFSVPWIAEAAITINEIAWMGTTNSANDEWIELYNSGPATNVDGWLLTDGQGLEIVLAGTVGAGQYAVLERTDDSSAPGTAFMVYTGALSNAGATLTLYDANQSVVDQVAGGEDWEVIGGDNATKETAQLTEGGWVTAIATPGVRNTTESNQETETVVAEAGSESETDIQTTARSTAGSASDREETASLNLIPRELSLMVTIPRRVYVNQAVTFSADGAGLSDAIVNSLQYQWNFGDSHTARSAEVVHRYQYPGNYVVSLHAAYKDYEAEQKVTITVLPLTISLTQQKNGDVVVHNDAKYEIDISGYTIAGVTMSERSFMLPGASLTLPQGALTEPLIMLHDETGKLLAALEDVPAEMVRTVEAQPQVAGVQATPVPPPLPPPTPSPPVAAAATPFQFTTGAATPASGTDNQATATVAVDTEVTARGMTAVDTVPAVANAAEHNGDTTSPSRTFDWTAIALISILLVGTLGVYTRYL